MHRRASRIVRYHGRAYGHLVAEIKKLIDDMEFIPVKVHRSQNRVSHALASYGRSEHYTMCWMHQEPEFISNLVTTDRNSMNQE